VRLKLNAVRNLYPKKEKEKKSRATPHKGNLGQGPSTHLSQGRNSRGGVGGLGPNRVLSKQDALQLFICQTLNDF